MDRTFLNFFFLFHEVKIDALTAPVYLHQGDQSYSSGMYTGITSWKPSRSPSSHRIPGCAPSQCKKKVLGRPTDGPISFFEPHHLSVVCFCPCRLTGDGRPSGTRPTKASSASPQSLISNLLISISSAVVTRHVQPKRKQSILCVGGALTGETERAEWGHLSAINRKSLQFNGMGTSRSHPGSMVARLLVLLLESGAYTYETTNSSGVMKDNSLPADLSPSTIVCFWRSTFIHRGFSYASSVVCTSGMRYRSVGRLVCALDREGAEGPRGPS